MAADPGTVTLTPHRSHPSQIIVGNGASLPVSHISSIAISTSSHPLHLNHVLISPSLIKNLISVRALTRKILVSVEFDPFSFSVKDLHSGMVVLQCNSPGELYSLRAAPSTTATALLTDTTCSELWHDRFEHPGRAALSRVVATFSFKCNKTHDHLCHACQLGKHSRLPFSESTTVAPFAFHTLHCDVWTSPILSNSGFQYFLVVLDDCTHFAWTFPLHRKSDVFEILITFHTYVATQFRCPVLHFHMDNGWEFDNLAFHWFLASNGIVL